jgi:hypothetical protein
MTMTPEEVHDEVLNLRAEIHQDFGDFKAETQKSFGEFKAEIQKQFGDFKADLLKTMMLTQLSAIGVILIGVGVINSVMLGAATTTILNALHK